MKNKILAEAIGIANRSSLKLATREHVDALYQAWQRAERLVWEYMREDKCTGITCTCPCLVCQSVRADDRQDKMDNNSRKDKNEDKNRM